jgi:hypothetical protein
VDYLVNFSWETDTHGVEEGHNNHGSGNKQMLLKIVRTENTEKRWER